MNKRILYVAYPVQPVSDESAGGAEQMLATLERASARAGYSTTTAACAGSRVEGQLYVTTMPGRGSLSSSRGIERQHHARTLELIGIRDAIGCAFDLVHDKSGSFFTCGEKTRLPILATLHLPRSFYPRHYFAHLGENVFFNCVSAAQAATFEGLPNLVGVVENGIALDRYTPKNRKKDYLLWLGRICEEKGTHIALDVAEKAGLPIVLAGQVYPFLYHQSYFDREVAPRLARMGDKVKFVNSPNFAQKLSLLQDARALVIPSLAEETSSLVAMEAAACGTPVIAFQRGALPEVVREDVTGLLVADKQEMIGAIQAVSEISPRQCRRYAEQRYSAERMFREYAALYQQLTSGAARPRYADVAAGSSQRLAA